MINKSEEIMQEMMVGKSSKICRIFAIKEAIRHSDVNVLIYGEQGTGKELLARTIHSNSPKSAAPFIVVSTSGIPEDILAIDIFGTKGEFGIEAINGGEITGILEQAMNGTLFLEDLCELTPKNQARLLAALKRINSVNGVSAQSTSQRIRIIASTTRTPEVLCKKKFFNEELLYYINVISIFMPPLRERTEDIPILADHFLQLFAKEYKTEPKSISAEVLNLLYRYPWPGNVRELKNVLLQGFLSSSGKMIRVKHLPAKIQQEEKWERATLNFNLENGLLAERDRWIDELQRKMIAEYLIHSKGNVLKASQMAKISRTSFHRLCNKYGINPENYREESKNREDKMLGDNF